MLRGGGGRDLEHYNLNDERHIPLTEQTEKNKNLSIAEPSAPYLLDIVARARLNPHKQLGLNKTVELVGGRSDPG